MSMDCLSSKGVGGRQGLPHQSEIPQGASRIGGGFSTPQLGRVCDLGLKVTLEDTPC